MPRTDGLALERVLVVGRPLRGPCSVRRAHAWADSRAVVLLGQGCAEDVAPPDDLCGELRESGARVEPDVLPADETVTELEDVEHAHADRTSLAGHPKEVAVDACGSRS